MREAAISKLDAKGWNTKEIIKGVTWSRVALLLGHVRELVLEISLDCQNVQVQQRADEIISLSQEVRNDLPFYLQWDERTETTLRLKSTIPLYIYLDLLYSNFLLQRILVKRSLAESETLVSLANQILKAMLARIAIPYFGLPSAGILAIEVLRQTQNARPWPSERRFARSEVIQNLSNLASHI
ncbi:chromatin structure remodeling complex protein RSC3 [Penicillium freii]|nr:chromatin structure remodeling complex protein RSC3 [Penicillium freii]